LLTGRDVYVVRDGSKAKKVREKRENWACHILLANEGYPARVWSIATGRRMSATNPSSRTHPTRILMAFPFVDAAGTIGAVLTTACWVPQATKIIRERDTRSISLAATTAFTVGIGFWLVYGVAIIDWPLIVSNAVTLALMAVILTLKLRHG